MTTNQKIRAIMYLMQNTDLKSFTAREIFIAYNLKISGYENISLFSSNLNNMCKAKKPKLKRFKLFGVWRYSLSVLPYKLTIVNRNSKSFLLKKLNN